MTTTKMKDAHLALGDRIQAAIERIKTGQGQMRVPVEATDPDVVLADCLAEVDAARAREAACAPYLKDGETPAECIARNRADADGVIELLRQARAREAKLRESLTQIAHGGPLEGQRVASPMKMYQAQAVARAALAEGEDTRE